MDSSHSKLTPFQHEVLREFFDREHGFYLTGGAALSGYYLGHRTTTDLDLFTLGDLLLERGLRALRETAHSIGAQLEVRQQSTDFVRTVLTRSEVGVLVDLVRERVPQLNLEKIDHDGIRIDTIDEILTNKITTLVSRAEVRDLVDVMLLEKAGHPIEPFLSAALQKDGGCTPAALAWALSQRKFPETLAIPGGVTHQELREYTAELVRRFRRAARPE